MNAQEMNSLINQADAIDQGEAAHAEAVASGNIDSKGGIIVADPNAAAMEWILIPETLAWVCGTLYPETAKHYSDERKLDLAQKIAAVAAKHGWSGFGESPELLLGMAALGFAMPAVMAHRARKKEPQEETPAGETDGS